MLQLFWKNGLPNPIRKRKKKLQNYIPGIFKTNPIRNRIVYREPHPT